MKASEDIRHLPHIQKNLRDITPLDSIKQISSENTGSKESGAKILKEIIPEKPKAAKKVVTMMEMDPLAKMKTRGTKQARANKGMGAKDRLLQQIEFNKTHKH